MTTLPARPEPGTPDNPIYFRFLRDEKDKIQLGKLLLTLGLTVLATYLAAQAQRSSSSPDQLKTAKMRIYRTMGQVANRNLVFWEKVAATARDRYEIAKL